MPRPDFAPHTRDDGALPRQSSPPVGAITSGDCVASEGLPQTDTTSAAASSDQSPAMPPTRMVDGKLWTPYWSNSHKGLLFWFCADNGSTVWGDPPTPMAKESTSPQVHDSQPTDCEDNNMFMDEDTDEMTPEEEQEQLHRNVHKQQQQQPPQPLQLQPQHRHQHQHQQQQLQQRDAPAAVHGTPVEELRRRIKAWKDATRDVLLIDQDVWCVSRPIGKHFHSHGVRLPNR